MHGCSGPLIHDTPADVLALEQAARLQGTGLAKADLPGFWQLHQTWSRRGSESTALNIRLLRALQACLILESRNGELSIANQVSLGPVRLRFDGTAELRGRRPLLAFSFTSMRLQGRLPDRADPEPAGPDTATAALLCPDCHGCRSEAGSVPAVGGGLALWIKATDANR